MSPRLRFFSRSFPLLFLLSARAFGAPDEVSGEFEALRIRIRGELNDSRLWAAIKTADRRAAVPGLSASQRVEALVEAADIRSQVGDQAGAERSLREALKLKPEDPGASFLLAQVIRDRPEQALPRAERAARFATSSRRKAAAHRLAAEIALDLEDKPGARSHLARALELDGEDLDALGVMVLAERDQPARAAAYARRACEIAEAAPRWKRSAALRRCAHILLDVEDFSGAYARLERALAIHPDDQATLWAMLHVKNRRARESAPPAGQAEVAVPARIEEDPVRTLAADPENLEALARLVESMRAENRIAEAAALAERFADAARRAPAWLSGDADRASVQMWIDLGDMPRAYKSWFLGDWHQKNLATLPNLPEAFALYAEGTLVRPLQDVARVRGELGDPAGAQAVLERVLARFPDNTMILRDLVFSKLAQSKPDEALGYAERLVRISERASLEEVLRRRPPRDDLLAKRIIRTGVSGMETIALYLKDPEGVKNARKAQAQERFMAFEMMSRVQIARGRPRKARAWIDRLAEVADSEPPGHLADIHVKFALVQRQFKDEAGAQASLERALSLLPDDASALQAMIHLQLSRLRFKEALVWVERLAKASEKKSPAERAGIFTQQARIQLELKDEAGAQASFERALELVPDEDSVLERMIQLQFARRRPEEALPWVERLAKASASAPPARRAGIFAEQARIQLELKDEAGAQASFTRALDLVPDEDSALRGMVQLELSRHRPREALAWVERLAEASESAPPARRAGVFSQKARIQLELKDEAGAQASFARALDLVPDDISSLRGMARIQLELKDEAGAQASLARALDLVPDDAPALHGMIQLELSRRRPKEALAWVERLAKVSEKQSAAERAEVFSQKARIQLELQDEAGAQASLARALDLAPGSASALQGMVQLQLSRSRPKELLALLDRWPAEAGQQAPRLVLRGLARTMLKEMPQAREDYRAAVKLDPAAACFSEMLSTARSRLDPSYFDLCIERFGEDPSLRLDRGIARYLSGQRDAALADFRKAVELNPGYLEARLSLASVLAELGRASEALAQADRAFALAQSRKSPLLDQIAGLRKSLRETAAAAPAGP